MKKSNKNRKCTPLEVVNEVASKLPVEWEEIDELRTPENKGKLWSEKCYIASVGAAWALVKHVDYMDLIKRRDEIYDELCEKGQVDIFLMVTATWRIHKQIYEFDSEMEKLLRSQADSAMKLPADVLMNLPYPCVFFYTPTMDIDGFFVCYDMCEDFYSLLLCPIDKYSGDISIKKRIISEIDIGTGLTIDSLFKENEEYDKKELHLSDEDVRKEKQQTAEMMQLVLYVCSQNCEREEDPEQKKILRQPKDKKDIKDKYREVQKWIYGKTTGDIIRKMKSSSAVRYVFNEENRGTGTPKTPHSRRGHWHSYWIGKYGTAERKLVLRWLAPMFIHKDGTSEVVTTNIIENKG